MFISEDFISTCLKCGNRCCMWYLTYLIWPQTCQSTVSSTYFVLHSYKQWQTQAFQPSEYEHIADFSPLSSSAVAPCAAVSEMWTEGASVQCAKKKKSKWFPTEGPWSVVQEVNLREKLSLHFQVAAVGRTPALPLVPFDPSDWPERLRRSRSAFSLCACSSSYLMTQKQWMFTECVSKGISWNNTPLLCSTAVFETPCSIPLAAQLEEQMTVVSV